MEKPMFDRWGVVAGFDRSGELGQESREVPQNTRRRFTQMSADFLIPQSVYHSDKILIVPLETAQTPAQLPARPGVRICVHPLTSVKIRVLFQCVPEYP